MRWLPIAFGILLASAQQQVIQVDVRLQQVTAVVRDNSGRFVSGLKGEDFIIEEDGVRQDIADFREEAVHAVSLAILADNCWEEAGSASALLNSSRPPDTSVRALLGLVGSQDEVSLMGCEGRDNALKVYEDFTSELRRIERHLGGPNSGTIADGTEGCCRVKVTRFEVIEMALQRVKKSGKQKPVLVLLSLNPNVQIAELKNFERLLDKVAQYEIPIYVFRRGRSSLGPPTSSTPIAELARESGGALYEYSSDASAPSVAQALDADIRSQYSIGYYLKVAAPSGGRTIRGRTKFPDHHVRLRRIVVESAAGK